MPRIAIVIPAFKTVFFKQTLESIANQTCKDFTLYIGNDASPHDLKSILDDFKDKIRIKYTRFEKNLGGIDLVAQWERCVDLVEEEEWIWLFSDDDIMESNCIENFYKTLVDEKYFDLFHFNVEKIDQKNRIIEVCPKYPQVYQADDFLIDRLKGKLSTFAIEYIFRKAHFLNKGRFQNFDLAWGSDDATWIKLSNDRGINTIKNSKVYWRESAHNITPNKSGDIITRKLFSHLEFAKWLLEESKNHHVEISTNFLKIHLELWFIRIIKANIEFLSNKQIKEVLSNFYFTFYKRKTSNKIMLKIFSFKVYSMFKSLVKKSFGSNYLKISAQV